MPIDLKAIVTHDSTDSCVACRAQDIAAQVLVPAAEAWEASHGLPRHSVALHGAAELLGRLLQAGVDREELDQAMTTLLDDIEAQLADDATIGPAQGNA
jgi:hypothetical protein